MKLFLNKKRILLAAFFSILLVLPSSIFAKEAPASFADLAEKLMPSVVNISATKVVETKGQSPFHFSFLQDPHLKIFLKNIISSNRLHKKENQLL